MAKIYVIGIGPGQKKDMTIRAIESIEKSDIVIGYTKYIELLEKDFIGKRYISSPMKKEIERCEETIDIAERENAVVSLVSSGDSGIYGMAGILLEIAKRKRCNIQIEVIPGVTAACASAALLGAPIMHDFAVISLSDLMTPIELIRKRITLAAEGDFVICFYNPKSSKRQGYVKEAVDIILKCRKKETPIGIVNNVGRIEEIKYVCTLGSINEMIDKINMFSTIIVGNSQTYYDESSGRLITPRGYSI